MRERKMAVVRPIEPGDLEPLVRILEAGATYGLTSLPPDREILCERIEESRHSFGWEAKKPRGESYLFVLEEEEGGAILGACGIVSKVGGFEPFYAYRVETSLHESRALKVRREVGVLHLVKEHSGPSGIGSLFLAPAHRGGGRGRLLSLSRFLFMAEFGDWFEPAVIAEMRGVVDGTGHAPFWEALGRHFFGIDFPLADYLSMKDKRFIGELMPPHPIYIDLLPREVQGILGEVHPETRPALEILQAEGFGPSGMVDIFDGGPIVRAARAEIRTVRESEKKTVAEAAEEEEGEEEKGEENSPAGFILSNARIDFRACLGTLEELPGGGVRIPQKAARALGVGPGDAVRYAPLRPGSK